MANLAFPLVWFTLLIAPIGAFQLVPILKLDSHPTFRSTTVGCLSLILFLVIAMALKIRTVSVFANFAAICLAYLAYSLIAASAFRIRKLWLRILALTLLYLPIAFGYLIATIGYLGLIFILQEESAAPVKIQKLSTTMTCEVSMWGMAFTSSGYTVTLYRHLPMLPVIEQEVAAVSVDQTDPTSKESSCEQVYRGITEKT